jgi:hypothetical protein
MCIYIYMNIYIYMYISICVTQSHTHIFASYKCAMTDWHAWRIHMWDTHIHESCHANQSCMMQRRECVLCACTLGMNYGVISNEWWVMSHESWEMSHESWVCPTLCIMPKYLRASPADLPFGSWYLIGTKHCRLVMWSGGSQWLNHAA